MDAKILHELFEYRDGELYWKAKRPSIFVGDKAGWRSGNGYHMVNVLGKQVYIHRVIYLMIHGELPYHVDHIDGNPSNNRIENLRSATKAQNAWNCKLHNSNSSGVRGVYWNKLRNKWYASVEVNKKKIHLGVFKELDEAKRVVEEARRLYYGEYVNHG